jgi:hypothetical protein
VIFVVALFLIGILVVALQRIYRREDNLADQLEDVHDPNEAGALVDFARMQDQEETNVFRRAMLFICVLRWW